jgi:hypothetical protein
MTIVIDVKVFTSIIHRNIVVAVAGNSSVSCIFIKRITARSIGNNRYKILITKVINPWIWGFWIGNYILSLLIIKVSKFHSSLAFKLCHESKKFYFRKLMYSSCTIHFPLILAQIAALA